VGVGALSLIERHQEIAKNVPNVNFSELNGKKKSFAIAKAFIELKTLL